MAKEEVKRINWAYDALKNHSSITDYNISAENKTKDYNKWLKNRSKMDFIDEDYPRKDIKRIMSKVYVGADSAKTLKRLSKKARKVLLKNFTASERKRIGKVYFEGTPPASSSAAASCQRTDRRSSIIKCSPKWLYEDVLTHELVHTRRDAIGQSVKDVNKDEKETEFETMGRSSRKGMTEGYYQFIKEPHKKGKTISKLQGEDKRLLTGSEDRNAKGKRLTNRLGKAYKKSNIQHAHFSPAEDLDRYFQIYDHKDRKSEIHIRFKKPVTLAQIRKDLKSGYNAMKAYEWRNGKRYLLFSESKPKARVLSKNRTTKRISKPKTAHKPQRKKTSTTYHGIKGKPIVHKTNEGRKYIMVRKKGGGTKRLYKGSKYSTKGKIKILKL